MPTLYEDVAQLRLELGHTDLSTLVDHGFVMWDHDENLVKKGPRFYAITSISNLPDYHGEELPDEYL